MFSYINQINPTLFNYYTFNFQLYGKFLWYIPPDERLKYEPPVIYAVK